MKRTIANVFGVFGVVALLSVAPASAATDVESASRRGRPGSWTRCVYEPSLASCLHEDRVGARPPLLVPRPSVLGCWTP